MTKPTSQPEAQVQWSDYLLGQGWCRIPLTFLMVHLNPRGINIG